MLREIVKNKKTFTAPFALFVRCVGQLSEQELFNLFLLDDYTQINIKSALPDEDENFLVTNDEKWFQFLSPVNYSLYFRLYNKDIYKVIQELGKSYDLFLYLIDDLGDGYNFEYYKDGNLVRKYNFSELKGTIEDFGKLPIETYIEKNSALLNLQYPDDKLFIMLDDMGVDVNHEALELRLFSKK